MKKYIFFFIAFALVFSSCTKEEGCTDPLATNFNVDAENDDGSCIFGLAGGEWITQSITSTGSLTATMMGFPLLDSTINYTETNPDSLEPYKLVIDDNGTYMEYDNSNNVVEGGSWSATNDQLTINTPDTTLVLDIISLDKNQVSFSINFVENSTDPTLGITFNIDLTQTINSNRSW